MHMADALLSPAVGMAMNAVCVAAIGLSVAKVKKDELSEKKVPIMGISGALVFAAQMINFAIPATGSSGHIGGGILLAGLLGGFPAFLSIAAVLIIQCLFFADGGLLALGSNIFNMGVIPCLIIYPLIFKPLLKGGADYRRLSAASILSAVAGLVLGSFCVVIETQLSGITSLPFGTFAALLLPIHLAIGLVEGIVTAAILCFIFRMRPELIEPANAGNRVALVSTKRILVALAALAIISGAILSLIASTQPDGLEWAINKTADQAHNAETGLEAQTSVHAAAANVQENTSLLPDYAFASDPENAAGTSISGIIGASATFALAGAAGLIISIAKKRKGAVSHGQKSPQTNV